MADQKEGAAMTEGTSGASGHGGRDEIHIALGAGFRGHTVIIVVDGREVFRGARVTTEAPAAQVAQVADVIVPVVPPVAFLLVAVDPGALVASLELDVSQHRHVAVSLVGEATIGIETYER
jgi:hypothetical protein